MKGREHARFTLQELQRLHTLLKQADRNKDDVVEALRAVAELLIWGDQNNPQFFEFFLENRMMEHFHNILQRSPGSRSNELVKQTLQTLSILLQNVKSEQALFFLFSNNHINEIIREQYDFQDDEVLGYYITFIKAISLKLNDSTVQFFISGPTPRATAAQESAPAPASFPIFSEAVKFATHSESMVRAAVRTLALTVFRLRDPIVEAFLLGPHGQAYYAQLASALLDQVQVLDRALWQAFAKGNLSDAASGECLAEVEDQVCFINDVLDRSSTPVARTVCEVLWENLAGPVMLWPLISNLPSPPSLVKVPKGLPCVRPVCALYILERFFHIVTHARLVNAMAGSLLLGSHPVTWLILKRHDAGKMMPPQAPRNANKLKMNYTHFSNILEDEDGAAVPSREFFHGLVTYLQDDASMQVRCGVLRCLVALIRNPAVDADLLDSSRMLPQRLKMTREMIDLLCQSSGRGGDGATLHSGTLGSDVRSIVQRNSSATSFGYYLAESTRDVASVSSRIAPIHARAESSVSMDVDALLGAIVHMHLDGSRGTASAARGSASRSVLEAELEDGSESISLPDELLRVMVSIDVPSVILTLLSWLLRQLLPASKGGRGPSVLSTTRREALEQALRAAQEGVQGELKGAFADTLPLLVHMSWIQCRQRIVNPHLPSTCESLLWPAICGRPGKGGPSPGASGLQLVAERVQRLVVMAQAHQLLCFGRVSLDAPVPGAPSVPRPLLKDGSPVQPPANAIPAKVSFKAAEITPVMFFTAGQHVEPGPSATEPPMVVLSSRPASGNAGAEVVSTAPLLGSKVTSDARHPVWLHVHVRPPIRNVARAAQDAFESPVGRVVLKSEYLVEGHWVLAMTDPSHVTAAVEMVQRHAEEVLASCASALAPLTSLSEFQRWGPGSSAQAQGEARGDHDSSPQIRREGTVVQFSEPAAGERALQNRNRSAPTSPATHPQLVRDTTAPAGDAAASR